MDYDELLAKYQALLIENSDLKNQNKILRNQLGVATQEPVIAVESPRNAIVTTAKQNSEAQEKIQLFMSLFKSRDDVYAKRWQNKAGKSGYMPVCLNEWKTNACGKPRIKCADCSHKSYGVLDEKIIEQHLRGNIVVGIYPMYPNETCYFLAIDFDDEGWEQDITVLRSSCKDFDIPIAIERSRSGNGGHAWFFFKQQISATLARKFGTALLTYSMNKRHEITFKSYDRLFPNQDTMPKGGFGNLIALPLQLGARQSGNSVFIDECFKPYADQWSYLGDIKRLSEDDIETLLVSLCHGNELGSLKKDVEEGHKPWEVNRAIVKLEKNDFPKEVTIIEANMLYLLKKNFSSRALNSIKRLAAFRNPEFYKAQAMRMPTFNKPRIISCADETTENLCLPRGCAADLCNLLNEFNLAIKWLDEANAGRTINVQFNGKLREEQQVALNELLKYDNGVLAATTAFGKTVVAANLIGERKVNTLVLVHRQQLLSQWTSRLTEFLTINEELPVLEKKRGRKNSQRLIGQIGAGKDSPSGIIDIAVMQSLYSRGEFKECIKNYGMVIVDECHHVSAVSFEQILKNVNAKYVYGLTATPTRKDGHHPIIFMHCGPVRYRDDAKKQAAKRPFEHYVIPRFTGLRVPVDKDEKDWSIQAIYAEIVSNEERNQLIINDVIKSYKDGRNSLVLTERTAHVELLTQRLSEKIPDVIAVTGGMGAKEKREILNKISNTPADKQLTLIATGKYIGEGFDEPRLDTMFLAMPISWKGTLEQYAGRLHRLYGNKNEVQIYDYVDVHIRMLEKMYSKRLNGYAAIGYKAKGKSVITEHIDIIFDKNSFMQVYGHDIVSATTEVVIVSPFVAKRRVVQMLQYLESVVSKHVKVTIVTRPATDFKEKDAMALQATFDILKKAGIDIFFKSNIHQKFTVIDQRLVWYGSINFLSYGSAEESVMRLENSNIANELLKIIIIG